MFRKTKSIRCRICLQGVNFVPKENIEKKINRYGSFRDIFLENHGIRMGTI
jgi:hypothetical protein